MLEILLIEDNDDDAHFIKKALDNKQQHHVTRIANGEQAFHYLLQPDVEPDVVLVDYHLPLMDGLDIIRNVREKGKHYGFIFLTIDNTVDVAVEAMKNGALDFLPKIREYYRNLPNMIDKVYDLQRSRHEKEQAEAALKESEREKAAILNSMVELVIYQDREMRVIWANTIAAESFGVTSEHIAGRHCYELWHQRNKPCDNCPIIQARETGRTQEQEITAPDGRVWFIRGYPILDVHGSVEYIVEVALDITERKRAEEKIRKTLSEKEVLLRELYHRTKNTMQVIRSMLLLQAARTPDNPQVQKLVHDTENRILTISLVHQKLYQSQDLSRIDSHEYIAELIRLIMQSYASVSQHISLTSEIEHIDILLDTAIPCGLILNELLTNSLQHAFPGEREGEISLTLCRNDAGNLELSFSDNGVGVPQGFDFREQNTLGLRTIIGIAERQMQGQIVFQHHHGVTCRIEFPDTLYSERV